MNPEKCNYKFVRQNFGRLIIAYLAEWSKALGLRPTGRPVCTGSNPVVQLGDGGGDGDQDGDDIAKM